MPLLTSIPLVPAQPAVAIPFPPRLLLRRILPGLLRPIVQAAPEILVHAFKEVLELLADRCYVGRGV